jgi:hypothetical protein
LDEYFGDEKNMEDEIFFIARAGILGNVEKGEVFFIFLFRFNFFYEFGIIYFFYETLSILISHQDDSRKTK